VRARRCGGVNVGVVWRAYLHSALLGNVYPAYATYKTVLPSNPNEHDEQRQRYLLMFW
jgi:hypothetical protein